MKILKGFITLIVQLPALCHINLLTGLNWGCQQISQKILKKTALYKF